MHISDEDFAGLANLGFVKICEIVGLTSSRLSFLRVDYLSNSKMK